MCFTEDEKNSTLGRLSALESEVINMSNRLSIIYGGSAVLGIVASLIGGYLVYQLDTLNKASIDVAVTSTSVEAMMADISKIEQSISATQKIMTDNQQLMFDSKLISLGNSSKIDRLAERIDKLEDK